MGSSRPFRLPLGASLILGVKARTLASILVDAGVITPDQVDAALVLQRSTGLRIGETLVEMG